MKINPKLRYLLLIVIQGILLLSLFVMNFLAYYIVHGVQEWFVFAIFTNIQFILIVIGLIAWLIYRYYRPAHSPLSPWILRVGILVEMCASIMVIWKHLAIGLWFGLLPVLTVAFGVPAFIFANHEKKKYCNISPKWNYWQNTKNYWTQT